MKKNRLIIIVSNGILSKPITESINPATKIIAAEINIRRNILPNVANHLPLTYSQLLMMASIPFVSSVANTKIAK